MSHIRFQSTSPGLLSFRISGCEQAYIRNLPVEGVPDIVRWLALASEDGAWVAAEDCAVFTAELRAACESRVRIHGEHGGSHSVSALRVGMSNYGPSDLVRCGDGRGPIQTWWSLYEWMGRGDKGDVIVSHSVNGAPWLDRPVEDSNEFAGWLRQAHPRRRWCRQPSDTCRPADTPDR